MKGAALRRLLYDLELTLTKASALFRRGGASLHNARFARIDEMQSLVSHTLQTETSLILGKHNFGTTLRVSPTPKRRELGNMLICAPTRGGKGLLAVSQLLSWKGSCIVNDIKGDLFTQTAGYRSTLGKVYVVDPTGIGNRYDPLKDKQTEDELLSSATHLLFSSHEGDGKIFTQRAALMLTQIFLAARLEGYPPLLYARRCVRDGLLAAAAKLDTVSSPLATRFLDADFDEADLSDRFLLSSWSTLSTKLYPLLTQTVVRSLAASDFTAGQLMTSEEPITVYLRWPEIDLPRLSPLVRLLWGSLIGELISTYDRREGQGCRPVLCLIDEAGRTAIPSLSDYATTVCGRGITLWISIQSLSQLDVEYGTKRAKVLRDNMETQVFYRSSDFDTARYLEERMGRHSMYARSETEREGVKVSQGLSEQAVPLMTAQEIMQMRDEDILLFHRSLLPISAKRMDWRRSPLLKQRKEISPPALTILRPQEREPQTIWQKSAKKSSYLTPIDPDTLGDEPNNNAS